jgi:hypothetical protein
MFRALGQVVHLIQDASVPEHVRNDQHLISAVPVLGSFEYEPWVLGHINPLNFSAAAFSFPANFLLRNFWDTDTYVDSSLEQGPFIGLAEYTSYNFFSEDTIFTETYPHTDKHYFPHPRKGITNAALIEEIAEDGQKDQVYYVHGYQANLLASYSYLEIYIPPFTVIEGWRYNRDSNVYEEYAGRLIPQAISYSAGLLDYFFRGKLSIETVDPNHVIVRNLSDDPLNDGTIELFCDDTDGKRVRVGGPISVSSIPKDGETSAITITPPPNIRKGYWAVFRGTLGAEQNAVIGSFTDLVWVEEWDKGFIGNHPWWVKMTDPIYQNYTVPGGSLQPTTVQDGDLTMSNFRPAGTVKTGPDSGVQNNQLIIGVFSSDSKFAPYNDSFPKTISPNTFIRIKVDAMSTAPSPYQPSGFCDPALSSIGDPPWWEYIDLNFSVDGREYNIKFTTPGNEGYDWSYYGYYNVYLTLGSEKRINVYQLFQSLGIPIPIGKTLQLNFIDIEQQLWDYCSPLSVDQQQSLQMDYLRILEETTPQSP